MKNPAISKTGPVRSAMLSRATVLSAVSAAVLTTSSVASAADQWWPFPVYDLSSGEKVETTYTPLEKAEKKWNLCVLFPHMKDSFWVAVAYGIVEEAKRQGVKMTLLQAGGYENLPKQISQFDDCVAAGADAIIVGAISEAGMAKKFQEGLDKNIPVISTVNPVADAPLTAKVFVEFDTMGRQTGEYLLKHLDGAAGKAVAFPGPQASGWAESFAKGFKEALDGSSVELLEEKFGDTGVSVQLRLIEDALQTYDDMTVIWGTAPTAEAAIGAVAEAGRDDILIMSSYENQAMLDAMMNDEILGFATQWPVVEGRIAIDMAVRALEKKELPTFIYTKPTMVSKENAGEIDMTAVLAPQDWRPVYSVD